MIPPLVLEPRPGDWVLDLAAAPGSKTTQMASLMKNQGSILANDNNPIRLEKLKANAALQGASNIKLLPSGEGGMVWKTHYEKFDRVLLDTPCSSEGRFQLEKPSSFGYWKEDTNRKMAKDQRRLFKSALLSLKPGGRMVYSTCTFAPEENEMILNWALETYGPSLKILEIPPFASPSFKRTHRVGGFEIGPLGGKVGKNFTHGRHRGIFLRQSGENKIHPPAQGDV